MWKICPEKIKGDNKASLLHKEYILKDYQGVDK